MIEDEALFDFPTFNIVISILQAQSAAYVNFNIRIHKIILRPDAGKLCQTQQSQDQGHTDIDTELCLFEIGGSGIVIDLNGDLIDSGKGMQHQHVGLRQFHFSGVST